MEHNLLFLGTGAADGKKMDFPAHFDNRSLRRCTCALLDGHILIDCGPHFLASAKIAGIDLGSITDILFTHLHSDHFNEEAVAEVAKAGDRFLRIYVREDAEFPRIPNCEVIRIKPFQPYTVGAFTVTGMPANHTAFPQHFSIETEGKKLFYGLDGAWLLGEEVEYMKKQEYDLLVLDATCGDYTDDYRMGEHNSIPMLRLMRDSMRTNAITKPASRIVLAHMAMCLHKSYEETVEITKDDGFTVSYDGMKLNF